MSIKTSHILYFAGNPEIITTSSRSSSATKSACVNSQVHCITNGLASVSDTNAVVKE